MDTLLKNKIEDILNGKVSVEQAQRYLSQITEEDIKRLIPQEKLLQLLDEYKRRNNFTSKSLPHISEREKEEIWQNIICSSDSFFKKIFSWVKEKFTCFFSLFVDVPSIKYGLATTIIILVLFPVIFFLSQHQGSYYRGTKGDIVSPQASFEFAIVDAHGKLMRPDQIITEKDTLAFRVTTEAKGFCSIYVIHENQVDMVIADKFLSKGVHDLNVGYNLSGNRGPNNLVMLFADAPLSIEEKEKQKLILELVYNNVSSMIIKKNVISIIYQEIKIR